MIINRPNYGFFAPLPVRPWPVRPWLFRPLACSPLGLFAPWLFHPLAYSPSGSFAPWLIRLLALSLPGLFAACARLIRPLACSPPGWFAPRWIYRWFIIEACVSIYRKATSKCSITSLITLVNVMPDKINYKWSQFTKSWFHCRCGTIIYSLYLKR